MRRACEQGFRHFGARVPQGPGEPKVVEVGRARSESSNTFAIDLFSPLATRYDALCEVLSMGQNRRWRRCMIDHVVGAGPDTVLDVGAAHPAGFWMPAGNRPVVVGPHRSVTVTLFPPSPTYFPPWASDWVVDAYTADPRSLSTTNDIWHNYIPKLHLP
jgi:hypothetical protein